jgi:hypothetical protein
MKKLILFLALLVPGLAEAQTRLVSATPTIDTSAYAAGDSMHTAAMTFTRALKGSSKAGILVSVVVADKAAQDIDLELWLFSTAPSSYGAANAAFTPSDAQLLNVVAVVSFGSSARFAAADNSMKFTGSIAVPVRSTNNDGDLYGVLVARGAYDADAANDLTVTLGIDQD